MQVLNCHFCCRKFQNVAEIPLIPEDEYEKYLELETDTEVKQVIDGITRL